MNNMKPGFKLLPKKIQSSLNAYCLRCFIFLGLLFLIAIYEIALNFISSTAQLSLFTISVGIFINYIIFWIKTFVLLLLPYIFLSVLSQKAANFFYAFFAIGLLLIQLGLIEYFHKSFVPLGSDLFAYSINDIKQTVGASGSLGIQKILLFIGLLAVFVFAFIYFTKRFSIHKYISFSVSIFAILFFLSGFTIKNSDSLKTEYARTLVLNKSDFFFTEMFHHFFPQQIETDIYSDVYSGDFGLPSNNVIKDFTYLDESKFPFLHKDETTDVLSPFFNSKEKLPNIVIILVEGLGRAFTNDGAVLGNFTPFLDSLSKESLYWKNFLSSGGRSFAVLPSVLGSLPFGKNGFNELGKKMPDHLSLINIADHNGYQSAFFYGGDSRFDNMDLFMKKNNINHIYDEKTFPSNYKKLPSENGFTWGYDDHELFRRYLELLPQDEHKPEINVLFTVAMHSPFLLNNQEKYDQLFEERMKELQFPSDKKEIHRQYKHQYASILFFDQALKSFIENYKQRSDFNNTIFIITGDHRMPEIPMISKIDRYHVPLIIYSPLLKRTATFSSISSHFDITPSLLAFLNHSYSFEKPDVVTWMGSGLDTTRAFSNNHQYPLMQTKNEVIDFIQGTSHLNGEKVFSITGQMDEENTNDKLKYQQLLHSFELFKSRNQKFIDGAKLIPDSIYKKYSGS
jgi:uncharacterized sulfatase